MTSQAYPDLPDSDLALIIRTDYSNQAAFDEIKNAIAQPVDGFEAYVAYADDAAYNGMKTEDVIDLYGRANQSIAMVVDSRTISDPEHPLLIIDMFDDAHRDFRAIPMAIQSVENNLSIANMDFADFADSVDADGVFRNFRFT